MKKIRVSLLLCLVVALTLSLAGCGSKTTGKKTVRIATEATEYPWTYTKDDEIVGYEADVINEIAKRCGFEVEWEIVDWDGIFGMLESGKVDTIASIVTITDERSEKYNFSQPYVYNPMVLATKSDSSINSMDDIDGKTIVVETGTSDELVLNQVEKSFNVTLEPKYYDGISIIDVENGRVDLWIGGRPSVQTAIDKGEYDLKIVGDTGYYQEYGYPFMPTDEGDELREQFDEALTAMKEDGTLKEISEKWLSMDVSTEDAVEGNQK